MPDEEYEKVKQAFGQERDSVEFVGAGLGNI